MSSIAYVTDEEMLEYHRLCRNRTMLFWRLASRRKIADFRKGDLLFFFARPSHSRKKALIGYAHYDSTIRLSLKQMWEKYGPETGYDSKQRLHDAIDRAAKGEIPSVMRCLYLKDVVFFLSPIYPEEVGLSIQNNLESYTYLDRNDPRVTVRILQTAAKHGIDLWSADAERKPDEIFRNDETRHQLAVIHSDMGKESGSQQERTRAHRLSQMQREHDEWESIRGSETDCLKMTAHQIIIAIPLAVQANDRDARIRELFGRMSLYRLCAKKQKVDRPISFEVLMDREIDGLKELVEDFNNEEL
ncbi:MAG: hypothetical protein LKF63_08740 [Solobacterium sp.]|jgi:hypothetical protein|nr:hypothetical protein [Solobacterium sp.]MCH4283267.1 hypothetical protein [Solobacterium sp.]